MKQFLVKNREVILKRWLELILDTYSADSAKYFKRERNQFNNPVGSTISGQIGAIFDSVINGVDFNEIYDSVDGIVSIRAVQEFSASEAVSFIFLLKSVIREELGKDSELVKNIEDLLEIENNIDRMALLTFDVFMRRREHVYRIRAEEMKNRTAMLLERTGVFVPEPEED